MGRKMTATLSSSSIRELKKELEDYRDGLNQKMETVVSKLLEVGITRAEAYKGFGGTFGTHGFEKYVTFTKKLDVKEYGVHGVVVGMGSTIEADWFGLNGEKRSGSINSLLAIEFGTAQMAIPHPEFTFGGVGGKGTNSQYGHQKDAEWYFITGFDNDGKPIYKYATAISPTRPMYWAAREMAQQMDKIVKETFRNG